MTQAATPKSTSVGRRARPADGEVVSASIYHRFDDLVALLAGLDLEHVTLLGRSERHVAVGLTEVGTDGLSLLEEDEAGLAARQQNLDRRTATGLARHLEGALAYRRPLGFGTGDLATGIELALTGALGVGSATRRCGGRRRVGSLEGDNLAGAGALVLGGVGDHGFIRAARRDVDPGSRRVGRDLAVRALGGLGDLAVHVDLALGVGVDIEPRAALGGEERQGGVGGSGRGSGGDEQQLANHDVLPSD